MKDGFIDNMEESLRITGVDVPRREQLRDGVELLNIGVSGNNNPDKSRSIQDRVQVPKPL